MHRTLNIITLFLLAATCFLVTADDADGAGGGLAVVLGCDDPGPLEELHSRSGFLVQALDTEPATVDKAREYIDGKGIYGSVSAKLYDGKHLPYIDNLANRIVVTGTCSVSDEEILRVLAPRGIADMNGRQIVKPVPPDIDDWSHWMHGPDNNPVANDKRIDVPRHLQWIQSPTWVSSHNLNPGVSAVITAGGRVFSIINEMPPGIKGMDDKWVLTARDAFNGLVLWNRPIKEWGWTHWSEQEQSVEMRFVPPFQVMRRMVATDDRLFVTPGFYSAVHVVDAASGEVLRVLEGTEKTFEVLHLDGRLYLAVNDSIGTKNMIPAVTVMAVDPKTGKRLWKASGFRGVSGKFNSLYKHANVFMTAGSGGIILVSGDELVCLDQQTGKEQWRAARPGKRVRLADDDIKSLAPGEERSPAVPNYRAHQFFPNNCAILHSDGVIVLTEIKDDLKNFKTRTAKTGYTVAYDAVSGKELWSFDCVTFAHFVPPDLFVIDGLVWTLDGESKSYVGLELRTGKRKKSYPVDDMIWRAGGHQLCFRNKATTEKIIFGRRKSEFIDIDTGEITYHAWIKGMCNYGVMPANGMIYYPPHNCSCFLPIKNTGFSAQTAHGPASAPTTKQLFKGKAYGRPFMDAPRAGREDWPMYRHNGARKGSLPAPLPTKPSLAWRVELGGALSQVVAVGERLYVAERDAHRICCLDRGRGTVLWRHTVGGRIDSAPTYVDGRILAGSRDGHVYCLDGETGERVWRFRGAPQDISLLAYDQLESVWPVHGSIVARDGKVFCLAGRSSYLNGGMHLYALNLETGKPVQRTTLVPDLESHYEAEDGVRSDLMVVDGNRIRVRHMEFAADDVEKIQYVKGSSRGPSIAGSLSAISGFLDSSWFNTTVWGLGSVKGQIMTYDGTHVFGILANRKFGQSCGHDIFSVGEKDYLLFCQSLAAKDVQAGKKAGKGKATKGNKSRYLWSQMAPIRGEAILASDNCVYLAGTRDFVDKDDPWAHVEGRRGGILAVHARADGAKLAELSLESAPVFDGMSASGGNVFLVARDGSVSCYR